MVNEQVKTSILMKWSRLHFATSAPIVWADLGSASFLNVTGGSLCLGLLEQLEQMRQN